MDRGAREVRGARLPADLRQAARATWAGVEHRADVRDTGGRGAGRAPAEAKAWVTAVMMTHRTAQCWRFLGRRGLDSLAAYRRPDRPGVGVNAWVRGDWARNGSDGMVMGSREHPRGLGGLGEKKSVLPHEGRDAASTHIDGGSDGGRGSALHALRHGGLRLWPALLSGLPAPLSHRSAPLGRSLSRLSRRRTRARILLLHALSAPHACALSCGCATW